MKCTSNSSIFLALSSHQLAHDFSRCFCFWLQDNLMNQVFLSFHPLRSKCIHEQILCYTLEINFACFTQCFQYVYIVKFVFLVHYLRKYLNNLKKVRFGMVWPTRGPTFSDANCKISLCQSSSMLYPILCYTEQNKAGSWNDCSNILRCVGSTNTHQ